MQDIREWLEKIPDQHLIFLGMDSNSSRPEWSIMKVLPVPPITVRPSITLDSGDRSEDDLTHKMVDVLRINQRLRENRRRSATIDCGRSLGVVAISRHDIFR